MVWQFNFDLYLILTEAEEKWKYMKIFYCSVVYTFLSIFNMNSLQISLFSVDRNSDKFNCIERMGTEVSQQVGWHRKQTIAWQWEVFIQHKTKHLDGAQREFFPAEVVVFMCESAKFYCYLTAGPGRWLNLIICTVELFNNKQRIQWKSGKVWSKEFLKYRGKERISTYSFCQLKDQWGVTLREYNCETFEILSRACLDRNSLTVLNFY